ADHRTALVVPGGLDQQPARVLGAGLRDRTGARALARLVERGNEPDPGGQLRRAGEALPVADLDVERERAQRVDAAEAAQAGDGGAELVLEQEPDMEERLSREQPASPSR